MTDRELLELAAKAAGLNIVTWSNCQAGGFLARESEAESGKFWNPLTDDGDALRLAVKRDIHIQNYEDCVTTDTLANSFCEYYAEHKGDKLKATRRAIVRATATEIGKTS